MKPSQIIGILIFLVIGISIVVFVKNEKKEVKEAFNTSTGKMETYDPETFGKGYGVTRMSEESMEIRKSKERNRILIIGGGIFAIVFIIFFVTKSSEDKKDPEKNLAILKDKNIISQAEYEEKLSQSKIVENEKRIQEAKRKEYKKLVAELDNLKAKRILSEQEYQEKLIKIKEKTA